MSTAQCESNLTPQQQQQHQQHQQHHQQQQQGLQPPPQQQPTQQQLNSQPMQSTQTPTPQPNAPLITTGNIDRFIWQIN